MSSEGIGEMVAEMLAGLEGMQIVTWQPGHLADDSTTCDCRYVFADNDTMGSIAEVNIGEEGDQFKDEYPSREQAKFILRHIARCSPWNIRRLATALVAQEAEMAALRMALAESRLFVSAVAGVNRPDRTWAVSLLGQIDAALTRKEG